MSEDDPFEEIERVIGQVTEQFGTATGAVPVDVVDADDSVRVRADLPGTDPEDVEVSLHDGHRLSIDVAGDASAEARDGRYVRRERRRQSVSRTISLPAPVDEESASATFENGVLTVTVDKRDAGDEGTEIPVN